MRRAAVTLALVLVLGLAAGARGVPIPPGPVCGPPTTTPRGHKLRLGAIAFPFGRSGGPAQSTVNPGYPTKALLVRVTALNGRYSHGAIVVSGFRCSDGKALRFAYNDELAERSPPYSREDMEARLGSAFAQLRPPGRIPRGHQFGYAGYMLFTQAGDYQLGARYKHRLLGTIVVRVVPEAS